MSYFFGPAPSGPGEGLNGQISFDFNYKTNFKDILCQTYQTGFSFCRLGNAPGVGLWGAGGAQGVIFF